ncbi:phosphatase 6 regulatory subunit 1-like protein fmt isoform X3 [Oratosquilla oratoria]|uniref:phosphatase 6 regulatory subunit 1-like protein fmt isoform X3 n=1 Tax=Oratosquilla oratoria TaxID=337810 RepID=UPI003F75B401
MQPSSWNCYNCISPDARYFRLLESLERLFKMFWKYSGYYSTSAQIDTLLQKEDVTLRELMDEEEILQECKAQNKKLLEYLSQPEVMEELVTLVVTEPAPDTELKTRFKYANLAAEILTSDVPVVISSLVSNKCLLDKLYGLLEREKPLNPLLASFFSKVLGMLVQRRSEQNWYSYQFTCFQVLDFLKSKGDFVKLMVHHLGTSAIMDLLMKLISSVEEDEIRLNVHKWLGECNLVEHLVEMLAPNKDSEEHASADTLLCEIINNARESFTDSSAQRNPLEDSVNNLLDLLLHEERNESTVKHVINILLNLLNSKSAPQKPGQQQTQQTDHCGSLESSDSDGSDRQSSIVARTIADRLPELHDILLNPPKKGLLLTAYGTEVEPLGSMRLQVVTLIAALVASNDATVHDKLAELNTVDHLLDLFFKFTLNNFLHTQVEQALIALLTQAPPSVLPGVEPQHKLLVLLLTQSGIIQRLLSAYEESEKEKDSKGHNLRGYMGHLRNIANTIVHEAEFGRNEEKIKELIQGLPGDFSSQWDDFVSNSLAEVNRKNEITPVPEAGLLRVDSEDDSDDDSHYRLQTFDHANAKQCLGFFSASSNDDFEEALGYDDDGSGTREEVGDEEEREGETCRTLGGHVRTALGAHSPVASVARVPFGTYNITKGFKDMDMDVMADFRYTDDEFKDQEDNLSGPLQRLSTQALGVKNATDDDRMPGGNVGGTGSPSDDLFEQLCTERWQTLDEVWGDKEREITFSDNETENKKEEESHSSSDEEEEDEFNSLRTSDDKMEVDQVDDWAAVFDKRSSGGQSSDPAPTPPVTEVNPWESALASDTSAGASWADFGSSSQSDSAFDADFSKAFAAETSATPNDAFKADFSSAFGQSKGVENTEENSGFKTNFPSAGFEGAVSSEAQVEFKADFTNANYEEADMMAADDSKDTKNESSHDNSSSTCSDSSQVSCAVEEEKEKEEEKEEEEEENTQNLVENFSFLASRGLMKSGGDGGPGGPHTEVKKGEASNGVQPQATQNVRV